ncbi:chorismate mutase/prephenate dehydratase [Thermosulfidibacter takaii ABI70S6]|uniref:Bifunctional chorismate mutase/prephenate dehydratase n=1 Tax=Thermosulfidibacter takaii (strain DSM 17441 / JCM 13301 / NBRC 103674 / ABI70S6) TaxID=1298851 RepID=A0A0S3QTN1_THET7|nr:prephenate dehydratase [Thermosulfidibacter takaii]BAT71693.1 chorismate mutase/prephenate dehydratase [Thermosulfidibacter takaii ABI70S6]
MAPQNEIDQLRREIDSIDEQILELLNKRASLALEIGRIKQASGTPVFVPGREKTIFKRLIEKNMGPFPDEAIKYVYREIISACVAIQKKTTVAFLGPEATFTHQAGVEYFGLSAHFVPIKFVEGIFEVVERGHVDYGVVPFENSTEGVVNRTLDAFMEFEGVKIVGEIYLKVSHHLLTVSGDIQGIDKIYSHPHAIAQCRKWLAAVMPEAKVVYVSSTAEAAKLAAEDENAAAIASEMAATLYGLKVAVRNIEDQKDNYTRFLIIGREETKPTGNDKTSLIFSLSDEVGALKNILSCFADRGINLTKIESRPSKKRPWDYIFYVDFEGRTDDERIKDAIECLKNRCVFVKILGSYPASEFEEE